MISGGAIANVKGKQAPSANSKTVQEAREILIKKKDRKEALKLLTRAARQEANQAELLREIESIAYVFLTEEGQRTYELAESLLYSGNAASALSKYEEALAKEPDNVQVLQGLVRARIARGECSAAEETNSKIRELLGEVTGEARYLRERVAYCLKQPLSKNFENQSLGDLKRHSLLLVAQRLVKEEKLVEAQRILESKDLDNWEMPEVYFWRYKAMGNSSSEAIEFAQKYLVQCAAITPAVRRKYRLEPRVCEHTAEAEEFVKRSEAAR